MGNTHHGKLCRTCKKLLPHTAFCRHKRYKDGLHTQCRVCNSQVAKARRLQDNTREKSVSKEYYHNNKSYFSDYCKQYYKQHRIRRRAEFVIWSAKTKLETFTHYGNGRPQCTCCGENIIQFLTLDHINNDGGGSKRKRGGVNFYSKLKKLGYPPGYTTLCFNCNSGRHVNGGMCPHITMRS